MLGERCSPKHAIVHKRVIHVHCKASVHGYAFSCREKHLPTSSIALSYTHSKVITQLLGQILQYLFFLAALIAIVKFQLVNVVVTHQRMTSPVKT